VTWLGDLGGGAASLAIRRASAASTSASTVFTGSDYGGSINLEGDVAAFVVATAGSPTAPAAPVFPAVGGRLSDALREYLTPGAATSAAWTNRARTFLTLYGGALDPTTHALTNRAALVAAFATKIQTFACNYLASRVRDHHITFADARIAARHIVPASQEVATAFMGALEVSSASGARIEATTFPSPGPATAEACQTQIRAAALLGVF
jgi:hypothetical protein